MKFYWLIIVIGDVEPHLHGPYPNEDTRDKWAKHHRSNDPEKKDGIYKLTTWGGGFPTIDSYSGGFFEDT